MILKSNRQSGPKRRFSDSIAGQLRKFLKKRKRINSSATAPTAPLRPSATALLQFRCPDTSWRALHMEHHCHASDRSDRGIASGKSLVAKRLVELGAKLIDADRVGWETYAQGTETYRTVIAAFGEDIVGPDGEIDRKALGAKVFGDAEQRRRLEAIVWPAIRRLTAEKLDEVRARGV